MSRIFIEESTLAAIGDSIRSKTGKTELISPLDMPAEIDSITGGGGGAANLIPLTVTKNGSYYPKEEIDVNKELTFRNDYTQEELQALFQASLQTEEDDLGVYAFLAACTTGMVGILYSYGFYGVYISDGHLWLPAEFANEMGFAPGWNFGTDIMDLAPIETPKVTFGEMDVFFVEGGLAPLAPLFDLPNADGFSYVEVDVAGGASIDGVEAYTVTYVGADGSTLHTKPVVAGDDTYNPYTLGKIEMPTKEPTQQYTFTYSGWSLTENGSASNAALECVQEDRTIYAAFTSTTNKYTARFWDGDTLMKEQQVYYGGYATPPDTTKTDYIFAGWTPSSLCITQDTDFYGSWTEGVAFSAGTWAQIAAIAESGQAGSVWKLGDTRTETVNGNTMIFEIAGFNHDDLSDGSGKAGVTIITKTAYPTKQSFSGSNWGASGLRTYLSETIFPGLSADLQPFVKSVKKFYDIRDTESLVTCSDKVWVPSLEELMTATAYGGMAPNLITGQGTTYAHFKNNDFLATQRKLYGGTSVVSCWTRSTSAYSTSDTIPRIYVIDIYGVAGSQSVSSRYFAFGFCL